MNAFMQIGGRVSSGFLQSTQIGGRVSSQFTQTGCQSGGRVSLATTDRPVLSKTTKELIENNLCIVF